MYQGRDREAIPFVKRGADLSPADYLSWMDLGIAYRRTSQREKAKEAFKHGFAQAQKAMLDDAGDGDLKSRLAYLATQTDDPSFALEEIREALRFSPGSSVTQGMAVWTYEALGLHDDAVDILEKSSDDVLMDAARWPDLAELHEYSRFKKLLGKRNIEK
jgi:Flp pilus assembly protein TadD